MQDAGAGCVRQPQEFSLVARGGGQPALADDGGNGTVLQGCFNEIMAVHALATHGKGEIPCGKGAGVNGIAGRLGGGVDIAFGVQEVGDLAEREGHAPSLAGEQGGGGAQLGRVIQSTQALVVASLGSQAW